jgi:REP element-mobilizing transposase RayT
MEADRNEQGPNQSGRKRIRLDSSSYSVPGTVWHVTIATSNRRPIFSDPIAAAKAIETIRDRCLKSRSVELLTCVMPDHVHLLVQIDRANLVDLVRAIKSILGIWCRRNGLGSDDVWQRSFYDTGIRNEPAMNEAVAYILDNPVKAGLAEDWTGYPWISGTLVKE